VALAERSLLAAIMFDPAVIASVGDLVSADDFGDPRNRVIYHAARRLWSEGSAPDVVAVASRLEAEKAIGAAGGAGYVFDIAGLGYTGALAERYASLVRGAGALNRLHRELTGLVASLEGADPAAPGTAIADCVRAIMNHSVEEPGAGRVGLGDATAQFAEASLANARARAEGRKPRTGLLTPLAAVNDPTYGGLVPGELYGVGARPKNGKTAFGFHLAEGVARLNGVHSLVCAWEDQAVWLGGRYVSGQLNVKGMSLYGGHYGAESAPAMMHVRDHNRAELNRSMSLVHQPGRGVDLVEQEIVKYRRSGAEADRPLGLVVVDHIGRLIDHGARNGSDAELRRVVGTLESVAKRHQVAILALSQLNRSNVTGDPRPPRASDIRGSDALLEFCSALAFIHRPGAIDTGYARPAEAWLLVEANRLGDTGRYPMHWNDQAGTYSDAEMWRPMSSVSADAFEAAR